MIEIKFSAPVRASVDNVWQKLAAMDDIANWSTEIEASHYADSEQTQGIGLQRNSESSRWGTLKETVYEWEEGRQLAYTIEGIPLVSSARSKWTLEPSGEQVIVHADVHMALKLGPIGAFLERLIVRRRVIGGYRELIAELKYYAENGQPITPANRDELELETVRAQLV